MILLHNVTIIDAPSKLHHKKRDILIKDGKIEKIATSIEAVNARVISAKDLHVSIGWIDTSVCIGEPGYEERETLSNGLNVAAHSGFTTLMMNPNNNPNPQDQSGINYLKQQTSDHIVDVLPVGNFTVNQKGERLAELYDMSKAGAVAFYDFKKSIRNTNLLKVGLQYVKSFNGIIQSYPQDDFLAGKGMVNEDSTNIHLGLKSMPAMAEHVQIARDIQLAVYTGAHLHFPTITTKESVQLIKEAKKKYHNISCSASMHHLSLDSTALTDFNTQFKIQPPLRNINDVKALRAAVKNGVIDCITSDHIPLTIEHKAVEFDQASYGSTGLESCFGTINSIFGIETSVHALTSGYEVFDLYKPEIKEGAMANLTLFNPNEFYTFTVDNIMSKSKNSAHIGRRLKGRAIGIINHKKVIWNE